MKKIYFADHEGWHRNTDLGCDLKTILSSDTSMQTGKEYQGVLRRHHRGRVHLQGRSLHLRGDAAGCSREAQPARVQRGVYHRDAPRRRLAAP